MWKKDIDQLYGKGWLGPLDYYFGEFIERLSGSDDPGLFFAAALTSKHTGRGNVCFDLSSVAGKPLYEEAHGELPLFYPELGDWRKGLELSHVVGQPGEFRPLILDEKHRLYLHRYWEYEDILATYIKERSSAPVNDIDIPLLMDGLARYFPSPAGGEMDWQKAAAFTSVVKKLCIISGGPGTGKTTTVTRILALLLEQASGGRLRIALVAPTGKAASRLEESIAEVKDSLNCPDSVKEAIPVEASTLHRLLGSIPGSPYFRHHSQNPISADVVVVDEASMVDLALMAKLTSALPDYTRLILLGDKDQLASVEAGAILGDICDTGSRHRYIGCAEEMLRYSVWDGSSRIGFRGPSEKGSAASFHGVRKANDGLADGASSPAEASTTSESPVPSQHLRGPGQPVVAECIVELRKSYRFGEKSGIGELSRAIKEGDGGGAMELLRQGAFEDISWKELPHPEALSRAMRASVLSGFGLFPAAPTLMEMANAFGRFRILTALRQGPFGAAALNGLVEQVLAGEGIIQSGQWYHARPIMVTRNDYNLKLFNGDIGFILKWKKKLTEPQELKYSKNFEGSKDQKDQRDSKDLRHLKDLGELKNLRHLKDLKAVQMGEGPAAWDLPVNEPEAAHEMRAVFPVSNGPPRVFPPARLPEHETVYATTVHKSQGSEFDEVLLMLSDRDSPVLTRELLYTGVTRARKRLVIWGRENVFRTAVSTRIQRSSGLRDAIWGTHDPS